MIHARKNEKKVVVDPKMKYAQFGVTSLFGVIAGRDHPIMKVFVVRPHLNCTQRCMIFGTALVGSIFVSALFYGMPNPGGESDDVPFGISVTPQQIFIAIYGLIFNAPFPLFVTLMCRKKVVLRKMKIEKKLRTMRIWKWKSKIGMTVGATYMSFCFFYLFMFSVSMKGDAILGWIVTCATSMTQKFVFAPLMVLTVLT